MSPLVSVVTYLAMFGTAVARLRGEMYQESIEMEKRIERIRPALNARNMGGLSYPSGNRHAQYATKENSTGRTNHA